MLYKVKNKMLLKMNLVKAVIAKLAKNCDEPIELNEENLERIYNMTMFEDFDDFKIVLYNVVMEECFVYTNKYGQKSIKLSVDKNRKLRKLDFEDLKNSLLNLYEEEKV